MIGAAVGAGVGIIGSIIGGIQAAKAAREAERELSQQRRANQAWYERRYNEDYTQTAEAQNLLTKAREAAKEQMQAAVGRQAVMGGTEEGVSAVRQEANDMLSNTLSDVAAQGTARKDAIDQQYRETERSISDKYMSLYNQRAANSTQAAGSAMNAGMGLVGASLNARLQTGKGLFSDMFKKNSSQRVPNIKMKGVTPGNTILPDYTKINDPYANLWG